MLFNDLRHVRRGPLIGERRYSLSRLAHDGYAPSPFDSWSTEFTVPSIDSVSLSTSRSVITIRPTHVDFDDLVTRIRGLVVGRASGDTHHMGIRTIAMRTVDQSAQ